MPPAEDPVEYLLDLPQYSDVADPAYKPGLERMETLMDAMNRPHESIRTVHVGGTNGKGSVASMIASIATASGLHTGLHTSPHVLHVTQRMRVQGTAASNEWLREAVAEYQPVFEEVEASFFEASAALTFLYFAEKEVDLAVVEVGLGGRLDATNVLHPVLSVITNIDLDHTDLLGETVGEIAREKAGIIKSQTPVLTGATQEEALTVIGEVAANHEAPLHILQREATWKSHQSDLSGSIFSVETPEREYERVSLSIPGTHQQCNAALAIRATEIIDATPDGSALRSAVRDGLGDVRSYTGFRGRIEMVQKEPAVVVDVGHNPPAIAASLDTVVPVVRKQGGTLYVCLNAVRGKGLEKTARMLADVGARVTPIPIHTERAIPATEIAERLRSNGVTTADPKPLEDALASFRKRARPNDVLLLVGSHKLVEQLPAGLRGSAESSRLKR